MNHLVTLLETLFEAQKNPAFKQLSPTDQRHLIGVTDRLYNRLSKVGALPGVANNEPVPFGLVL